VNLLLRCKPTKCTRFIKITKMF